MGTFATKVRIANVADPSREFEFEAMVDTGATYSWIAESRLAEIGVRPLSRMQFRTITGGTIERSMAGVVVASAGKQALDNVAVAQSGDMEVIGAFTLEALGVAADVVKKQLVPTVALALTAGDLRAKS